jgi:hypothetical protein
VTSETQDKPINFVLKMRNNILCSSLETKGIVDYLHGALAKRAASNNKAPIQMKRSTQYKYANIVAPDKGVHCDTKNERRVQALRDMYAAVSHASILHAILQPVNGDTTQCRIEPRLKFNMDEVSCLIGKKGVTRVRLAEGSKKALQNINRSPSQKENLKKCCGVKQLYLAAADGTLRAAIVIIKDSKIQNYELYHLDFPSYDLYAT